MLSNEAHTLGSEKKVHFDTLLSAAVEIEKGNIKLARAILINFPKLSVEQSPADLKSYIFLKALWKNVDPSGLPHEGNLYLRDFASRQIDLFNLMATRMPMVKLAVQTANDILSSLILQHPESVLIDVGIGTGQQIVQLIKNLKGIHDRPLRIRVVGIEPSEASLKKAESNIRALASPSVDLHFEGFLGCAESLPDREWERINSMGEMKIINEAFALHHVSFDRQGVDHKTKVLEKLRALDPVGFVLSEPHSDHHHRQLSKRLIHAWKHFGLVFDVIDAQAIYQTEKDAMKLHFFAREVDDILGTSEPDRTERHESAEMWIERLQAANFHLLPCQGLIQNQTFQAVQTNCRADFVSLEYASETVVAVIAATSY